MFSNKKLTDRNNVHKGICTELHDLYVRKNADYGNSFATARKEIPFYTLGKLHDKFSRYKNLCLNGGDTKVKDETIADTLLDLANYCIMELTEMVVDEAMEACDEQRRD